MKKFKFLMALVCTFGFLAPATGAGQTPLQKGVHYELIDPPQPTEAAGKIEVIEFFSFGCPHCYHLEPAINDWVRKLPQDVFFYRVPLAGGRWAPTAKLFYTLDALGVESKLRGDAFSAIHGEKSITGNDEAALAPWAGRKGVDVGKFNDIYKSFAIQSKTQRAVQLATSHRVTGVPALVVDGRYLVLNKTINSYEDLLALTSRVVDMARASKK